MDEASKSGGPACGEPLRPEEPGRRKLYVWAVALLFALALACRLYPILATHQVTNDSAASYLPIAEAIAHGEPLPAINVEVPILYSQVTGYLTRLTGDVELSAKLVSMAGSLLLCGCIFLLARKLFGPLAAFAALALVAFNPYQCDQGTETNVDGLALGWLGAAAFLTVVYLQRPRLRLALALGVFLGLMSLTRAEGVGYALFIALLVALFPAEGKLCLDRRRVGHALAALAVALCVCLPRLCQMHRETGWYVTDMRQVTQPAALWHRVAGSPAPQGAVEAEKHNPGRAVEWFAGAFGPASLVFGVYGIFARRRRQRIEWVPAALIAAGFVVVAMGPGPTRRYYLPMSALWQLWAGVGLIAFLRWLFERLTARRRPEWRASLVEPFVLAAAAVIAITPVFYFVGRLDLGEQAAERAAGQWLLQQCGRGQPILSKRPITAWYARGEWLELPPNEPGNHEWTGAALADFSRARNCRFIILDGWLPGVERELKEGKASFGRIVHESVAGGDRVAVVELATGG